MTSARFFSIDDSLWPLLRVRLTGKPTDEHYEDLLDATLSYLRRREPVLVLNDMLHFGIMTSEQRHRQLEWLDTNDKLLRETLLGTGFVMDSAFLRLGLNIIIHNKPPACPYVVVPRMDLALRWAADRLEATGLRTAATRVRGHESLRISTGTG